MYDWGSLSKNADCPFITNFNLFTNTVSDIYRIFAKKKIAV